jgi:hypothetical protein
LAKVDAPAPLFDTWGGGSGEQLRQAARIGVNCHILPIGFFHLPVEKRIANAAEKLPLLNEIGMIPGISFYNHPSKQWMKDNAELMVHNAHGNAYTSPGAHTSLWNPRARQLWRDHIRQSLAELKKRDVLKHVRLVKINPGEEGEVSYSWSGVWAHDPHARQAWQNYIKAKYETIDALNDDFGTDHRFFKDVKVPCGWYPDRYHAVFADFYRLSMLRYCVEMADVVRSVFQPEYWLWMPHTIRSYPMRFYAARYPLFYCENLQRLGLMHYAHLAVLDWQSHQDIQAIRRTGTRVVGEIDVAQKLDRMLWTFDQCEKYGTDGMFIGVTEVLSEDGELTDIGQACKKRIADFQWSPPSPQE